MWGSEKEGSRQIPHADTGVDGVQVNTILMCFVCHFVIEFSCKQWWCLFLNHCYEQHLLCYDLWCAAMSTQLYDTNWELYVSYSVWLTNAVSWRNLPHGIHATSVSSTFTLAQDNFVLIFILCITSVIQRTSSRHWVTLSFAETKVLDFGLRPNNRSET